MFANVREVKDGERKARNADNMYFVGGRPGGGAGGVVTGALDTRELSVPLRLWFVAASARIRATL